MPIDMILEAMKVVYTKSISSHSRSSFFSRTSLPRGSQYGFMDSHSSSSSQSVLMPAQSAQAVGGGKNEEKDFRVSFLVKVDSYLRT